MAKFTDYLKAFLLILILLKITPPIIKSLKQNWTENLESKNQVGCIIIDEQICSSQCYCNYLQKFFKDPEIKAILLKIDSPGGATGSTQAIALEIAQLKKEYPKPIVAYSENICTSGAYYVAVMCDYIVTTGSCVVGGIGAKLATQFKIKQLLKEYKIETLSISAGAFKNSLDPFSELTDEQKEMLQHLCNDTYEQFSCDVAKQRHLNIHQKNDWANGKIFNGNQALLLKLIDATGNESTALDYIKQNILHSDREIVLIKSCNPSLWQRLFQQTEENDTNFSLSESFWKGLIKALKTTL
ncbi:signal peptide peptidase SppA [Candidatus Dependentiae bacterium]|nr:signal peptide peptidase SppA [Candidatus Dependentiae bacterium]